MGWSRLWLVLCLVVMATPFIHAGSCPMGCYCDETVVDCSALMEFPTDLPADTTVFLVSHLNVYEIPPYAFGYLRNITRVELTNCNVANVASFAFYKTPSLKEIIFDKTVIANLESYSFNGLENITKIQFSNARIGRIKPFAFYEVNGLREFNVINVHIRNFYTHSFYDCHSFDSLFIKNSNLSDFVTGAFVKTTDISAVYVEDTAFWNMHCDVLDGLEALSANFRFTSNTFYCNCSVSWLFSDDYSHLSPYTRDRSNMCHGPDNMKNKALADVDFAELGCKRGTPSTPVKCKQHTLKPRPKAPPKGRHAGGGGGGAGDDPENCASLLQTVGVMHVLQMFLICWQRFA